MILIDTKYLMISWDRGLVQYRKFKASRNRNARSAYLQVLPLEIVVWWK